jgi:predicted DNA-binding transcriptional regulator AlpA
MLPGMEEYVRDSVAQPATPNSRPQGREHDVELAFQHLKSRMKPLLTKREAADFYTVSERTIDRWVLDATLPNRAKIIIGGSVRFRTDVLLECIAASGTTAS